MAPLDSLVQEFRIAKGIRREYLGHLLAERGEPGVRLLAELASDGSLPSDARLAALRYLPTATDGYPEVLATLLDADAPALRAIGSARAGETGAREPR